MNDWLATGPALVARGRRLALDTPVVMGVLNLTPDSFSDGGVHEKLDAQLEAALAMVEAGAAIIDIGGESTRPGAQPVSASVELARVLPLIEALRPRTSVWMSIDTQKPEVMRAAVETGCDLINDVGALKAPGALAAAAELEVPVVLVHMQGVPATMQLAPHYGDAVDEVKRWLGERILACEFAGIPKSRIVVDPGFGFGKQLEHNLALLAALEQFRELGCPVLAGLSRKRMIGELTGVDAPAARLAGSVAAALLAAERGASILRVHDVAATTQALAVLAAVRKAQASLPKRAPARSKAPLWPDEDEL